MSFGRPLSGVLHTLAGSADERRAIIQLEEQEREAQRQGQLEAQTSPLYESEERIRIWERLHMLSLPRTPDHELVRVIARQTRLTIPQIHAEQQRRTLLTSAS